jgi:hypothetical protein
LIFKQYVYKIEAGIAMGWTAHVKDFSLLHVVETDSEVTLLPIEWVQGSFPGSKAADA